MQTIPQILITFGIIIIIVGILWSLASKFFPIGKLPGDFIYKGKNTIIYFPLATSLIISIFLTLIFLIITIITKKL